MKRGIVVLVRASAWIHFTTVRAMQQRCNWLCFLEHSQQLTCCNGSLMLLAASFVPLYTLYLSAARAVHPFFLSFFLASLCLFFFTKILSYNNKFINLYCLLCGNKGVVPHRQKEKKNFVLQ